MDWIAIYATCKLHLQSDNIMCSIIMNIGGPAYWPEHCFETHINTK